MAYDKLVDSTQLDSALTATANALRAKSGSSDTIPFDSKTGFQSAVESLPSGGGDEEWIGWLEGTNQNPVLPNGLTKIGESCFISNKNIVNPVIPNTVTTVGKNAFEGCYNLALTSLPDGITKLNESVFKNCSKLALTSLPDGITSIEDRAFQNCSSLALSSLPNGVVNIGKYAFDGCYRLALTSLPENISELKEGVFKNCWFLGITKIPSSVKTIDGHAFYSTPISELTFEGTVTSIDSSAFENSELKIIRVPWSEGEVANAPWGGNQTNYHLQLHRRINHADC